MPMHATPACTIASNNYLALARVLVESYRKHHPGAEIFICIVDRRDPKVQYSRLPFTPVFAEDLGIPGFLNLAFRYDITELNTSVKPFFLAYLREHCGVDRVAYFDPDILVHDSLVRLHDALDNHYCVLTPHIAQPLEDTRTPSERTFLLSGIYNLGFLGLRLNETTRPFLEWWKDRLYRFCVRDIHQGLFLDQRWIDFAPAFLDSVHVVRDPIYNVAYWNLPHRHPNLVGDHWEIEGRRVGFFHFSGIDFEHLDTVSRYQDRLTLAVRPELRPLWEHYRGLVVDAGHEQLRQLPYGYGSFLPGTVPIPPAVRRELHLVDPLGRRWEDPFDTTTEDSFFSWLVTPLAFASGVLNRAVLALWEARPDLIRAFPHVCGGDLPRYVEWLLEHGEGKRAGFPEELLSGVRVAARDKAHRLLLTPGSGTAIDAGVELTHAIDLRNPGASVRWLNDPVPGVAQRRPVITRCALLVHQSRPDLQAAFPEPLGPDQLAYAVWFCYFAPKDLGVERALVNPMRRSLPLDRRLQLILRHLRASVGRRPNTARPDRVRPSAACVGSCRVEPLLRRATSRTNGVNVVAHFHDLTGVQDGTVEALKSAKVPAVRVPLDGPLVASVLRGQVHHPEGVPYAMTLLHASPPETARSMGLVPASSIAGGYKVGYWFWGLAHAPLPLGHGCSYLDEIWAPTHFCQKSYEAVSTIPVRHVPPCALQPPASRLDRGALGLEEECFYFFSYLDVRRVVEGQNPLGAIEAVRRLAGRCKRRVTLLMMVAHAEEAPDIVSRLRLSAGAYPVQILSIAATQEMRHAILSECDASLSLHRCESFGVQLIESMYLGKPVVATGYGGVTDYLDPQTGYPVPYQLERLCRDYGPYPSGAVWAQPDIGRAVDAMCEIVDGSVDVASRAVAGRHRVIETYGVEAASQRFLAEVERVFELIR